MSFCLTGKKGVMCFNDFFRRNFVSLCVGSLSPVEVGRAIMNEFGLRLDVEMTRSTGRMY